MERGDVASVGRHEQFRLFAAMNPATDAGKRELPPTLRNRFTEVWVGEPQQREDLAAIIAGYLLPVCAAAPVDAIVEFYLAAKADAVSGKPAMDVRTVSWLLLSLQLRDGFCARRCRASRMAPARSLCTICARFLGLWSTLPHGCLPMDCRSLCTMASQCHSSRSWTVTALHGWSSCCITSCWGRA